MKQYQNMRSFPVGKSIYAFLINKIIKTGIFI